MILEELFVYLVAGLTSLLVFAFAIQRLRLNSTALREVLSEFVECVGAFLVFLVLNVGIGMVVTFGIRTLWKFFPLYAVTDLTLILMSAAQGFIFQLWWRRSRSGRSTVA